MSKFVTCSERNDPGFGIVVRFGAWRVAQLAFRENMTYPQLKKMERHMATDEVFVLQRGQAVLIIAEDGETPDGFDVIAMQAHLVYNVKRAAWHQIIMWPDALVLIVENDDTSEQNSEYAGLNARQLERIDAVWQAM